MQNFDFTMKQNKVDFSKMHNWCFVVEVKILHTTMLGENGTYTK